MNNDVRLRDELSRNLTNREKEVAILLCRGETHKSVADMLHISSQTVKNYSVSIHSKTGMRNDVELMRFLIKSEEFRAKILETR